MAQEYLMRWPTSTGNRKTFTWAGWTKYLKDTTTRQGLFSCDDGSGHSTLHYDNEKLYWNTASYGYADTSEFFRDFNAWNHVVWSHDSTQQEAADRVRLWVNGVQCRLDLANLSLSQNAETDHNRISIPHYFGCQHAGEQFFEGYLMDVYLIDGLALRPENFGYYKRGKGAQNIGWNSRTSAQADGKWAPLPPRVVKENIKRKGGFGTNGGYYPMNYDMEPGLDFQKTPDTILKLNTHEQQPKGGLYKGKIEVREDPFKDNLILAVPFVNGGLDDGHGDYSHLIKGAGTPCPATKKDAQLNKWAYNSLWYGSAAYYNNSGCNVYTIPPIGVSDYCIEFWSRRHIANAYNDTGNHGFFSIGTVNQNGALTYALESNNIWLRGYNDGGSTYVNILSNSSHTYKDRFYPPGQWVHTAITRKVNRPGMNPDIMVYINGELAWMSQEQSYNGDDLSYTYCAIGAINDSAAYPWEGSIQDFRIYKGTTKYDGGFVCPKPYFQRQGSTSSWNHWQTTETWRVTPDTPENNYAVWTNSPGKGHSGGDQTPVHLEGNLLSQFRNQSSSYSSLAMATGTGKWYCEVLLIDNSTCSYIGVNGHNRSFINSEGYFSNAGWSGIKLGSGSSACDKKWTGSLNQSAAGIPTYDGTNGNIIGMELDTDNGVLKIYKDGKYLWEDNTLPRIGGVNTNNDTPDHLRFIVFRTNDGAGGSNWSNAYANFGNNPTFTDKKLTDPGTFKDANGRGLFTYQPPPGCKALCTANFPEPAISNPNNYFKPFRYDGDDSAHRSITGIGFQPDISWHVPTSTADYWINYDSVTGSVAALYGNGNNAAFTGSTSIQQKSFNDDGETLGSWNNINGAGRRYNGFYWKAGGNKGKYNYNDVGYDSKEQLKSATGVDLLSSSAGGTVPDILGCSIGTTPGLSIIQFTGTGASADIPHGLGKEPYFIIVKKTSGAGNSWGVYHKYVGSGKQLLLNSSGGVSNDANGFDAEPDDKVIHVGSGNAMATNQSGTNIMYAWAEVEGFSKFGMYYGNNDADGPHIYCGFRPAFVICKRADSSGDHWCSWNTAHNPFNKITCQMNLNLSNAEICNSNAIEISSTGFKHVGPVGSRTNGSGVYYIFMAWAECPTKYANTLR